MPTLRLRFRVPSLAFRQRQTASARQPAVVVDNAKTASVAHHRRMLVICLCSRRCDIPERGSLVKWSSRCFLASLFRQGTHGPRRSPGLRFECLRLVPLVARSRQGRRLLALIAHGLFSESGRSRSCPGDCTSTHPFVRPLALRLALRQSDRGWPGTVLFFTTILRDQARPNHTDVPLGYTPDGFMSHLGLSKARRDRDERHDRCNHFFVVLRRAWDYQCVTQGGSSPKNSHSSRAAV